MNPTLLPPADAASDHVALVARAALAQASSPTARLAQRLACRRRQRFDTTQLALVRLFAVPDAGAAAMLDGSFHPHVARRHALASR